MKRRIKKTLVLSSLCLLSLVPIIPIVTSCSSNKNSKKLITLSENSQRFLEEIGAYDQNRSYYTNDEFYPGYIVKYFNSDLYFTGFKFEFHGELLKRVDDLEVNCYINGKKIIWNEHSSYLGISYYKDEECCSIKFFYGIPDTINGIYTFDFILDGEKIAEFGPFNIKMIDSYTLIKQDDRNLYLEINNSNIWKKYDKTEYGYYSYGSTSDFSIWTKDGKVVKYDYDLRRDNAMSIDPKEYGPGIYQNHIVSFSWMWGEKGYYHLASDEFEYK